MKINLQLDQILDDIRNRRIHTGIDFEEIQNLICKVKSKLGVDGEQDELQRENFHKILNINQMEVLNPNTKYDENKLYKTLLPNVV